ncbi:MAG: phosphate ABC transporter substrate-binding protein [Thermoanaerobaculia bacterium]|nr:phosphate ABC transporter substrate-binding protein [Thermoanaerobaculia bacterium]
MRSKGARVMKNRLTTIVAAAAVTASVALGQTTKLDPNLPAYKKASGISGNLSSVGSDTMNNLATLWGESFRKIYPSVKIQVEGKGSSTAPPALIEGTAQLGPMSRKMKKEEIDKFEAKYGYPPTGIRTALDGLAVYVNKDNPIQELTLEQVDAIFSKGRKLGYKEDITTWGQLGATGEWANKPVSLYGRNSASGTYGYFKEVALGKGDYKDTVKEQPGSASVVQGVSEDKYGIGYSGIGYSTSNVKPIKLAKKAGQPYYAETYENVLTGKYPLARYLYVYLAVDPFKSGEAKISPLTREFLRYALSKDGQEAVVKDGYFPLPANVVREELRKIS